MSSEAFTIIQTTRTAVEADALVCALAAAGFHPLELETASHFSLAGVEGSYSVKVPSGEANAAREFLLSLPRA